jgi:hypothetical protein
MQHMYGIEMQIPVGKLPGFYAQVIHKIGDQVNVFDRDDQLYILENEEEYQKLSTLLSKSAMLGETFALLHVPSATSLAHIEDVGFISQDDRMYLYADRVALFSLDSQAGNEQDRWAALEQLREHLLGELPKHESASAFYILDPSMTDLAEGIAKAYRVSLIWLHR